MKFVGISDPTDPDAVDILAVDDPAAVVDASTTEAVDDNLAIDDPAAVDASTTAGAVDDDLAADDPAVTDPADAVDAASTVEDLTDPTDASDPVDDLAIDGHAAAAADPTDAADAVDAPTDAADAAGAEALAYMFYYTLLSMASKEQTTTKRPAEAPAGPTTKKVRCIALEDPADELIHSSSSVDPADAADAAGTSSALMGPARVERSWELGKA